MSKFQSLQPKLIKYARKYRIPFAKLPKQLVSRNIAKLYREIAAYEKKHHPSNSLGKRYKFYSNNFTWWVR